MNINNNAYATCIIKRVRLEERQSMREIERQTVKQALRYQHLTQV